MEPANQPSTLETAASCGPFTTARAAFSLSVVHLCAGVSAGAFLGACGAPASSVSFLVTGWSHERPMAVGADIVAPGIDVDGRDDREEREACTGALDFVSPTGRHGIDNQYAAALVSWLDAGLGDMTDAVEASDARGWIIDVSGIDDLRDDVLVAIYAADGEARGELLVEATGQLRGEWLEVTLGDVALPLGDEIGMRRVEHARLRLRLFPEGELRDEVTGELGASVPIETVLDVARVFEPGLALESAERMAMPDLDWDGDGACEAASLGVGLEARRIAADDGAGSP